MSRNQVFFAFGTRAGVAILPVFLFIALWANIGIADDKIYRLEMKESEKFPMAKFSGVEGTVGQTPHRYLIDKLGILQPISIAVRTLEPENKIKLTVHKYTWDEPERSLTTDDNGTAIVEFRTQGEFQFQVQGSRDYTPYQLLVMVGDEVPPVMPRVVLSEAEYEDWESSPIGGSTAINWWTVVVVILLAAILLSLFKIYRRMGEKERHV